MSLRRRFLTDPDAAVSKGAERALDNLGGGALPE